MNLITYPLNNIEYRAEDAELFHCTRTSGVWAEKSFTCTVSGEDNNITVDKGVAWIQNTEFAGKVVAMKGVTVIDAGVADDLNDRIDVVAIQFDANENETKIVVKHGDPVLTNPQIPEINRSGGLFELYLCSIYRTAGKTAISSSDVTDLRLNPDYCGLMADSVTKIDTSMIESQVTELIDFLKSQIDDLSLTSENVIYDNSTSGAKSENAQDAIDEVFEIAENKLDADAVIDVPHGGTGRSTLTSGYFLKGNGTSAITMQSAASARSALGLGSSTGVLDVSYGGTGRATLTSGYFLKGNGTSSVTLESASNVAETISEKGTFTPKFRWYSLTETPPLTYNLQSGFYTKIGKLVFAGFQLSFTVASGWTTSGGDYFRIDGFPYNSAASSFGNYLYTCRIPSGDGGVYGVQTEKGLSNFGIYRSNGDALKLTNSNVGRHYYYGTIVYETD